MFREQLSVKVCSSVRQYVQDCVSCLIVKVLLCKHEDLSLDPQQLCPALGNKTSVLVDVNRRITWDCWSTSETEQQTLFQGVTLYQQYTGRAGKTFRLQYTYICICPHKYTLLIPQQSRALSVSPKVQHLIPSNKLITQNHL